MNRFKLAYTRLNIAHPLPPSVYRKRTMTFQNVGISYEYGHAGMRVLCILHVRRWSSTITSSSNDYGRNGEQNKAQFLLIVRGKQAKVFKA